MTERAFRWLGGLALMASVWLALYWLLVLVGASRWIAFAIAMLAAVSLEPKSYLRRGLAKYLTARRPAGGSRGHD